MTGRQHGIALLDSMIALVIFSVGIVGMVALQAMATTQGGDARYRHAAGFLADDIIARMWVADPATLAARFAGQAATGGESYVAWMREVDCATARLPAQCLPGVKAYPPSIAFDRDGLVTVTLQWAAPGDSSPHRYVSIADVSR